MKKCPFLPIVFFSFCIPQTQYCMESDNRLLTPISAQLALKKTRKIQSFIDTRDLGYTADIFLLLSLITSPDTPEKEKLINDIYLSGCEQGHKHIIKYALQEGANVDALRDGQPTLLDIISKTPINFALKVIHDYKPQLVWDNPTIISPTAVAMIYKDEQLLRILIKKGAEVNPLVPPTSTFSDITQPEPLIFTALRYYLHDPNRIVRKNIQYLLHEHFKPQTIPLLYDENTLVSKQTNAPQTLLNFILEYELIPALYSNFFPVNKICLAAILLIQSCYHEPIYNREKSQKEFPTLKDIAAYSTVQMILKKANEIYFKSSLPTDLSSSFARCIAWHYSLEQQIKILRLVPNQLKFNQGEFLQSLAQENMNKQAKIVKSLISLLKHDYTTGERSDIHQHGITNELLSLINIKNSRLRKEKIYTFYESTFFKTLYKTKITYRNPSVNRLTSRILHDGYTSE